MPLISAAGAVPGVAMPVPVVPNALAGSLGTPVMNVAGSVPSAPSAPQAMADDGRRRAPVPTSPTQPAAQTGDQAKVDPLAGWGEPAAPLVDPRRFTEAHWQGLEVIPNTPLVAQALNLPPGTKGVIVDDVTLPADLQGFQAGDVVTHVGQTPTPDLTSFIQASEQQRDMRQVALQVQRKGELRRLVLTALIDRLGNANGETPSMIPPGARMPHPYRGPCTNCHRIGTSGTLPVDQGDMLTMTAPQISPNSRRPHRDRGPCTACHQIVQ